ncbi:MAG TPA: hypothetical protein VM123_13890 [archaeon]|nr:hypothetical protein [archaeon]
MKRPVKRLLFWTPRVLCILFAIFVSLFALDVFSEGYGFWKTILALLIHLIPTYIIIIVLIFSWRWEWVGGILFTALGAFYIFWVWGRFTWLTYLVMSGPLFLVGVLFLVNWVYRAELRASD